MGFDYETILANKRRLRRELAARPIGEMLRMLDALRESDLAIRGRGAATVGQFLLYTAPDGAVKVDVFFRDETVWLTQKALAELFGVKVPAINKHLKNIFESGELAREATISKMEIARPEGGRTVSREVEFYNLDAIIAVGYRVNSYQATQFRIWATKTLREFMIKGFVLDDERLKQGKQVTGNGRTPSTFPISTGRSNASKGTSHEHHRPGERERIARNAPAPARGVHAASTSDSWQGADYLDAFRPRPGEAG